MKPVILAVDDDRDVLSAIDRDLRAHYRQDFRVLRAGSGREALETVRELQRRGAAVALFLVDQRMPQMTGTEFLNEARAIFPDAKKVLLTAYADTQTAIDSINTIGLDYYLMKPWDPPAERLYPVLDDLLSDWTAHVHLPFEGLRLAGARWSQACYVAKEFLSRNNVPYQWLDIDQHQPTRDLVQQIAGDLTHLPVALFTDGTHLIAPTVAQLAAKLGLDTRARQPFYDLIIVGAGPAGLASAVYGSSEGLRTLLVELHAPGGQAGTSSRIENYLGFPSGISGADLATRAVTQARRFGTELLTAQEVVAIRREDPYRIVTFADGSEVSAYAVILATGMAVRQLDVPGLAPLIGAGVYYGAALTEAAAYRGQDVCVIGGANSAGQGAMFFSRYARKVTILVRAASLGVGMSDYLVKRIEATPNIEVRTRVQVAAVQGSGHLECVTLCHVDTGETIAVPQAGMFIFIGAAPRSEMLAGIVERDEKGFVLTGPDLPREGGRVKGWPLERDPYLFETSVPGILAVGDVRSGANRRVAAAVGEGSAAVYTVHRYLETV